MQGLYQDGKRVGQWTWWHSNGMKQLAGAFEADRKTGQWTWWHANGLKAIRGELPKRPAGGYLELVG
jgi:antitoxin component YwqK of YwqJK toxin-antitoxin module